MAAGLIPTTVRPVRATFRLHALANHIVDNHVVDKLEQYPLLVSPPVQEDFPMRMLLRVAIPTEAGNAAVKAGTLGATINDILAGLKPEAVYFFLDDNGQRTGSIVFDMKEASDMVAIAEPWFLAFGAKISLRPAMTPEDLGAAGPGFEAAIKKYGK